MYKGYKMRRKIKFHRLGKCKFAEIVWIIILVANLIIFSLPDSASAYVGPGAGLTMFGTAVALILVILVALAGLIIWPFRVFQRYRKKKLLPSSKNPD